MKSSFISRLLRGAGIAWLVILALMVVAAFGGRGLDASSKAYVEATVPLVFDNWDVEALKARLSHDYYRATSAAETATMFRGASGIGKLRSVQTCQGGSNVFYDLGHWQAHKTAHYVVNVTFDKAPAVVTMDLVMKGGVWLVRGWGVNSKYWLDHSLVAQTPVTTGAVAHAEASVSK